MKKIDIKDFFNHCAEITEKWLKSNIKEFSPFSSLLTEAMEYSLFAGGKRLRPALIFATYGIFSDNENDVLPFAASIEALHTYSLIHDDLPAMDNDDLRRGKPTNHKVFGEAEAILAGDALLTKAFEFISNKEYSKNISDSIRLEAVYQLSLAAGDNGMVAGQFADIKNENKVASKELVDFIHLNKTAALIRYSTKIGALVAGASSKDIENLDKFGKNLGIAFQIIDDILDITSDTDTLGKNVGSDLEKGKATYPAVLGIEKSNQIASNLIDEALEIISIYNEKADILSEIARYITERKS